MRFPIQDELRRLPSMLLGAAIVAFGLYNVHAQSAITEGGVLGATLLIAHFTGVSPAVSEVVLDVVCYALGMRYLGKRFLLRALATTCAYSAFYAGFEHMGYLLPDMSAMPLLASLVGAVFVGVGVGLIVRVESAGCGDDALALAISKRTGLSVARVYLITDLTVLTLSVSYIPLANIACSLVTVMLSSAIIDRILSIGRKVENNN